YSGPLTPEVWQEMFIPEWQKLEAENAKVR
ncbi:TPA: thiol:disulfide interchange protein, partial [Pasteurella multocida]|nr:thiol:disulfide interchange protein [Pasteurella multocida]